MYNYGLDFRIVGQEDRKDIQRNGLQSENKYSTEEWKNIINEAIMSIAEDEMQYITTDMILRKIKEFHNDFSFIDWATSIFIEMDNKK